MTSLYNIDVNDSRGQRIRLEQYRGKVLLIVNVASRCGLTPQYEGLEKLYREYRARGLEILGFPCNQFGAQEPGDDATIQQFCSLHFDVGFPVMAKIEVNGSNASHLYKHPNLRRQVF